MATEALPSARPVPHATPGTLVAVFGVVATVALVTALRLPATVTVVGLAMFGILHNVLELRYVSGRFGAILTGRFLGLLLVLITGIMLCRLVPMLSWSAPAEILLGYLVLAVGCWWGLRRPLPRAAALAALGCAAVGSLTFPAYHFVFLAHLHNLVPLFFLWEWARDLERGRAAFRATQLAWVLLVPALILAGTFDPWIGGDRDGAVAAFAGGGERLLSAYAPPAWLDTALALRLLVVFAFLQTMHYVVWVWFMPRHARAATECFERRAGALRGRRAWLLGAAGAALLAVLFASDYAGGKTLYGAVASYHAYLEFPVLLALLAGGGPTKEQT
ncbi:hypothetical protein ACQPZP_26160 [Spirillospora sp. CA-142024]|uniref:hypothetical protein n=1 Tax=Spirillospora sp. CA-142024 TaxID=3240036 RepID=UPI003D90E1EA